MIYIDRKKILKISIALSVFLILIFVFIKLINKPADEGNNVINTEINTATSTAREKKSLEPYVFTKDDINSDKTIPKDTNNDGISDEEAQKFGLDKNKIDNDGDGIFDIDEISITKTDPLKADTDGDGMSDLEELNKYKTDPLKADKKK